MKNKKWFKQILQEIGKFQLEQQSNIKPEGTDYKSRIDLVTDVDRESERRLVEKLRKRFPEDGILAEEEISEEGTSGCRWIIDPLDGTTNYVHQHPFFGISVARQENDEVTEGYTYFPVLDDYYWGQIGKKAYKNGEPISVAAAKDPVQSLLATGFADMRTEDNRHNLPVFSHIIKKVRGIRRAGSAVHDLCMVAEGVFDGFWEYNLAPWDVAAGAVIIRCAGGKVTDMKGGENWLEGKRIVASNTHLHDNLLEWIQGAV